MTETTERNDNFNKEWLPKVDDPFFTRKVVQALNEGVAEYRLKRSGVENPTPEQISKEAAQTPGMLGQENVLVEDRGQYFEDLNEWLNTTLEDRYLSEKSEQDD